MKDSKIPKFGIIDTMDLYSGKFYTQGVSLEKCLLKLKIPYDKLHNGGNDTIFTMQVFMKIINNPKKVPLQLSKKLLKQNNEQFKSGKDKLSQQPSKSKKQKEEGIQYKDFIKLIHTIKFNIGNNKSYLCLDIEAYEQNQSILTEFGWCIFKKNGTITKKKHVIVKENMNYHNGKKVPDHRNNYLFGESEIQELKDIEKELKKDIESVNYIVGQGINNDIRYLKYIHVNMDKFVSMRNSKVHKFGIIDTMDLYSGYFNVQAVSLEKSLLKLKIPYDKLHNGGNDSVFTMQVFLKIICNLEKVPLQLPKEFLKEEKEEEMIKENSSENSILKNKVKEESEIYEEYSKLISTIRHNISENKLFMSISIRTPNNDNNTDLDDKESIKISELGWCIFEKDGSVTKKKHILFKKYSTNQNVPDAYLFGTTETEEEISNDVIEELKKDIEGINYLIGQGIERSLHLLKSMTINVNKYVIMKTPKIHKYGAIDTIDLYSGQFSTKFKSLSESMKKLQLPCDNLNNSGNDTIFAMQIFLRIINNSKKVPLQLKKPKMKDENPDEEMKKELDQADLLKN
ncbi:hypothetical protein BCR36DRAFT_190160 [Piromyces finnis]|uniref:Gfd2/YDR514C-like C-terminal domain-containing protein n=1 Tax=Piromyces finnis TaxID=1754191 RepID=A0A1Y1UQN6_9FUNG|nr:hypothetical protein BCR36DRAFT_190160 [Piromyces finnis]|eukprot:ORX40398.1 hypothetical protein BCR36DRAFT_190160 [Piromyces finnis]